MDAEIRQNERKLAKLEETVAKDCLAKADVIQKNTALEIGIAEKRNYHKNRPNVFLDKSIVDLQTTMNDIGQFIFEKNNLVISFEASQTARSDYQTAQVEHLQNEILTAEAKIANDLETARLEAMRQEAVKQKTNQYYEETKLLIDKKSHMDTWLSEHELELNQLVQFKMQLQEESEGISKVINDNEHILPEMVQEIGHRNELLDKLTYIMVELENEITFTMDKNQHYGTKMKNIRKAMDRDLEEMMNAKAGVYKNVVKIKEQYESDTKFRVTCEQALSLVQEASYDSVGLAEVVNYWLLYVARQKKHLTTIQMLIMEKQFSTTRPY